MRRHLISTLIGGLLGPIAGACAVADVAGIRNVALVQVALADPPGRRRNGQAALPPAPIQSVTDRPLGKTSQIRRAG